MSLIDRLTIDPSVCGGRPTIRGLRIRVKDVLDLLAAGAQGHVARQVGTLVQQGREGRARHCEALRSPPASHGWSRLLTADHPGALGLQS